MKVHEDIEMIKEREREREKEGMRQKKREKSLVELEFRIYKLESNSKCFRGHDS